MNVGIEGTGTVKRSRVWPFLVVPVLMLCVATVHLGRVMAYDQSTWKGAGFGMFATYDETSTRHVVAWAVVGGERVPLSLDDLPDDLVLRARVTPSEGVLLRIAGHVVPSAPSGSTTVSVDVRGPLLQGNVVRFRSIRRVSVQP